MKKLLCFLILALSVLQTSNAVADVPFEIKLPFSAGESMGITCIYHDIEPDCITHAALNSKGEPNRDEWAIDFNLSGIDDCGKSVVAVASGTVIESTYQVGSDGYGYGNYIDVDHSNNYKSRYAHLNSRVVQKGDYVSQGQEIGKIGSSGTDACHLHFVLYQNNTYWSVKPTPMSGYNEFYSTAGTADYPFISNNYFATFTFNDGTSQGWMPGDDARNIPFIPTRAGTWMVGVGDFDGIGGAHPGVLSPLFNGISTNHFSTLRFIARISMQPLGVKQGYIWIRTSGGNWDHQLIFTYLSDDGGGFHAYQAVFIPGLSISQISIELTRPDVYEEWEFDEIKLVERKPETPKNLKVTFIDDN